MGRPLCALLHPLTSTTTAHLKQHYPHTRNSPHVPSCVPYPQDGADVVEQVDLVPTLAALLGVPVPYSNLGAPIPDVFGSGSGACLCGAGPLSLCSGGGEIVYGEGARGMYTLWCSDMAVFYSVNSVPEVYVVVRYHSGVGSFFRQGVPPHPQARVFPLS
jgi:hypothetical protein